MPLSPEGPGAPLGPRSPCKGMGDSENVPTALTLETLCACPT